jgi:hypothetical protein
MENLTLMSLLGFIVIFLSIFSGLLAIKKNLRDYTKDVVSWQVALEHRLTQVETNVNWIKEHLRKRKGDFDVE